MGICIYVPLTSLYMLTTRPFVSCYTRPLYLILTTYKWYLFTQTKNAINQKRGVRERRSRGNTRSFIQKVVVIYI